MVAGASLMRWFGSGGILQLYTGTVGGGGGGGCTYRHSDAQVSSEIDSSLEPAGRDLSVEVGECRVVVLAHMCPPCGEGVCCK